MSPFSVSPVIDLECASRLTFWLALLAIKHRAFEVLVVMLSLSFAPVLLGAQLHSTPRLALVVHFVHLLGIHFVYVCE